MSAAEALAMAHRLLELNDPYEIAKELIKLEGEAAIHGVDTLTSKLIS